MKKIKILSIALLISVSAFCQAPAKEMAELMKNMKEYTLEIANQMPEEKFDYKPDASEDVRSYAQIFKHTKNFAQFCMMMLNDEKPDLRANQQKNIAYENSSISKTQIIADLSAVFDESIKFFNSTTDSELSGKYEFYFQEGKPVRSKRMIAMLLRDHITHHRAQATIYLRENGIVPAAYQAF